MKKIVSLLIVMLGAFAFVFAGCSKKQDAIVVPTFKSNTINLYLKDYAAYCDSVKEPAQLAQVPERMKEFAKRQAEVVKELDGEAEINAFNKCITDIRERLEKKRLEAQKSGSSSTSTQ